MLDTDISTADALRHLQSPEPDDRATIDRRRFLQLVGMGMGAGSDTGGGGELVPGPSGSRSSSPSGTTLWLAGAPMPYAVCLMRDRASASDAAGRAAPVGAGLNPSA